MSNRILLGNGLLTQGGILFLEAGCFQGEFLDTGPLEISFTILFSFVLLKSWPDPLRSMNGPDCAGPSNEKRARSEFLCFTN